MALDHGTKRAWTTRELETLRRRASLGASALAALLDRTEWSVRHKARRAGISLRPSGERRGKILGEPRNDSWSQARELPGRARALRQLRADIIAGHITHADLDHRMRASRTPQRLCPTCGHRPIDVEATGLCRPCHVDRVLDAYTQTHASRDADRTLDRERQRRSRARRRANP